LREDINTKVSDACGIEEKQKKIIRFVHLKLMAVSTASFR